MLLDVGRRELATFVGEAIGKAEEKLLDYEIIAGVDVRSLLRTSWNSNRASVVSGNSGREENRDAQQTRPDAQDNDGPTCQGSCGISRPGDEEVLRRYLRDGKYTKLRRGSRLTPSPPCALPVWASRRRGSTSLGLSRREDPAPWAHQDGPTFYNLMERADELRVPLRCRRRERTGLETGYRGRGSNGRTSRKSSGGGDRGLFDEQGYVIEEDEIRWRDWLDKIEAATWKHQGALDAGFAHGTIPISTVLSMP